MAGRKLFINNKGLDVLADYIYETTEENKDVNFVDKIECRQQLLEQFKLAARMNKVSSISVTENSTIRIRTRDLFISNSDTGILRKFFVGKWLIEVDRYGMYHFKSYNKQELGFRSSIWGNNTVHPHISGRDGHGCLGNAEAPLQYYLKTGAIKAMVMYVLGYLESVNLSDSAGISLGYCKEVALDDEGNVLHGENGDYLFKENEFTNCIDKRVASVSSEMDKKHHEYLVNGKVFMCSCCKKLYNKEYEDKELADKGESVCVDCAVNITKCDICGRMIKEDAVLDEKQGIRYCSKCASAFVPKCNLCDEYIFPKIDKDNILKSIDNSLRDNDRRKNISTWYKSGNSCTCKGICDSCKDLIDKNDVIKQSILSFTKSSVTKDVFKIVKDVPLNTYKMQCVGCGETVEIEDMIYLKSADRLYCPHCASYKVSPNEAYRDRDVKNEMDYGHYNDNYINLTTGINNNNKVLLFLPLYSRAGEHYHKQVFKNQDEIFTKYKEALNCDDVKYRKIKKPIEEITRTTLPPVEEPKIICPICGEEIIANPGYTDKRGEEVHEECAAKTKVKCDRCGKYVYINQLGRNINVGLDSLLNVCDSCIEEESI